MRQTRNLKGQIDIFYLLAIFFAVVIALGAALYLFNQLFGSLNANPQLAACTSCTNALAKGQQAQSIFPNAVVFIFILMCMASVILSAFLDSSPVFIIFVVISIPIELLVAYVFHDAFFALASQSFIGGALAASPAIALLFEYMPILVLVMSIIIGIITFIR